MKKTLAVLSLLIIFVLTSCSNHNNTQTETTTLLNNKSLSTETTSNKTETELIINNHTETIQSSSKTTEKCIDTTESDSSDKNTENVPPYILTESIKDLKQIKAAAKTMNEADFSEFMKKFFNAETTNGMNSIENAEKYLSDFENTYIIYVDELDEDNVMAYYIEQGDISYKIPVDDIFVITGSYYIDSEKTFEYREGDIVKQLKTYEIDGMIIELYENTSDEKEGLYGNIRYDSVVIPFFTNIKISVELFESVIERIGVVKIGDLLE